MGLVEQIMILAGLGAPRTKVKVTPAKRHGAKLASERYWEKRTSNGKMPDCSVMTRQRRRCEERTRDKAAWRRKRAERVATRKAA